MGGKIKKSQQICGLIHKQKRLQRFTSLFNTSE
ncbi:hypothetical protein SAMN05444955_1187 [Lihuaxuella thermophila]|uniref:Uncharacterized protein n=1 Tax=Lihuaxuella thermophila TaxID=1173111 RepID=A0A1H8IKU6_9BACL|nr:hypothetical protein SAMN05444955_1187 [Lihuaxuella thermophila]